MASIVVILTGVAIYQGVKHHKKSKAAKLEGLGTVEVVDDSSSVYSGRTLTNNEMPPAYNDEKAQKKDGLRSKLRKSLKGSRPAPEVEERRPAGHFP